MALGYYTPDQFISHLQTLAVEATSKPKEECRRGYVIRRSIVKLTPAETKAPEEAALKTLAEAMRKKKAR